MLQNGRVKKILQLEINYYKYLFIKKALHFCKAFFIEKIILFKTYKNTLEIFLFRDFLVKMFDCLC